MKYIEEKFSIIFNSAENKVVFNGTMRLWSAEEYAKISQFLLDVNELNIPCMILDFHGLEFLNSAGINMLCKFILQAKKLNKMPVKIIGNKNILWQVKSFSNLKLLWQSISLNFN